ncbi:hypothetical protein GS429_13695 [Natronorubrum sp. JWXQ-INN-674]|uniref:Cox cluster protein n=1 Tax=Natronorubrum halalkaliphilum TaxID=2691917 RepID=A0A6B0VQP2_9EURY|nr:hypothetical protein [Natronorubrum halalkaliphilum]MXV63102.1 hypothetical protein [Natronorubrum halalkaliphilum]
MNSAEQTTPTLGIALGIVLVLLGSGAYVLSEFASVTALIPAVFGIAIVLLGIVGRQPERRRLAVYGIGGLALLGVFGSARGIPDVIALLTGGSVDSTVAAVAQGSMILIGLILLVAVGRDLLDER